jgi:Bifunctional DNA primase/polymerase, N-terminal
VSLLTPVPELTDITNRTAVPADQLRAALAAPVDVLAGWEDEPIATETLNIAEVLRPKFLVEALKMAERGIPVSFLPAGQKGSNTLGWQESATTDAEEIIRRAGAAERLNYACVAKATPGAFLFLDDDGGIRAEYEKVHGAMIPTLKAQSCSGSYHYTFKHSAKSIAYQHSIGKAYVYEPKQDGKGELWSLRMHNSSLLSG